MTKHVRKSHNVNLMLYHLVCPSRYRVKVFNKEVDVSLKEVCQEIELRYEVHFVEIGSDKDHVHFLIQSVPMMLPSQMVRTIKSITVRELFKKHPEIKKKLWGGKFWTSGYYINTVGKSGNERVIKEYVKNQGKKYHQIYRTQLKLFEGLG